MKKTSNVNFSVTKTIISYDLSRNDVSAAEIVAESNNQLALTISLSEGGLFFLPNTTLVTTLSKNTAIEVFNVALQKAKNKKFLSHSEIARLLVIEVEGKSGYIENLV